MAEDASMTADRVTLGDQTLQVRPLGIGTWAWGDRRTWGYGREYGDAELEEAFQAAVEAGVELFDTAEIYGSGRSETLLGEFMRRHGGGQVIVATKFFPYPWRLRRSALVKALQGSLKRLGLPRVDLYQIHWPFPPVPIETWVDALGEAVELGLARAAGVSNYSRDQMLRAYEVLSRRQLTLASNQVEYSLLHRAPEENGVLDACRQTGAVLIAYGPLAKGLLTGKYGPDNPPRGFLRRTNRSLLEAIQPLVSLLRELGEKYGGKSPAQVALNWVIGKGAIPIPGAKNARQARENAGALGWRLEDDDVARLDEASARVGR
ncbi:MAG: aldo/keto reductase [Anaerolineae bacterium]